MLGDLLSPSREVGGNAGWAFLSGLGGPIGALGRYQLGQGDILQAQDIFRGGGAENAQFTRDAEGNLNLGPVAERLLYHGRPGMGLPLLNNASQQTFLRGMQEDRQAHDFEKMAQTQQYAIAAEQRAAQAASQSMPPAPLMTQAGTYNQTIKSNIENHGHAEELSQLLTAYGVGKTPATRSKIARKAIQLGAGWFNQNMEGAASEDEFARAMTAATGGDPSDLIELFGSHDHFKDALTQTMAESRRNVSNAHAQNAYWGNSNNTHLKGLYGKTNSMIPQQWLQGPDGQPLNLHERSVQDVAKMIRDSKKQYKSVTGKKGGSGGNQGAGGGGY